MLPIARLLVLASLFAASTTFAQTMAILANGDTYLKSGSPNQNEGTASILRVQSSGKNRSLVRFDRAAIDAAVGSGSLATARLELFVESNPNNWGTDGRTVDAHRLLADWSETGATWNCGIDAVPGNSKADCSTPWNGGAFAEEPTDTVLHTNGLVGWISFDVTADVRDLLGGGQEFGWLVKKTDEGASGQVDYTSRGGDPERAPRLVLVVESAAFDEVPPRLAFTAPVSNLVVGDPTPEIRLDYADGGTGVDLGSFALTIDGSDVTASCTLAPTGAVCEPPLADGSHTLVAGIADQAGNPAQATRDLELLLGPGLQTATFTVVGDTYLRDGSPNQNQGGEPILRVRQNGKNRALVRFDAAAVAAAFDGATLRSARLEVAIAKNGDNWGAAGRTVDAQRVSAEWTEVGATWNCAVDADPTNQQPDCSPQWAGGSYVASPTASVLHANGLRGMVSYDVTADVAAMLAGGDVFGWLLRKTEESQSGLVEYRSREDATGPGPALVVVFELADGEDTDGPIISELSPAAGAIVGTSTPIVSATLADLGIGVDVGSFRLAIDGVDRTAECAVQEAGFSIQLVSPLADGPHSVEVRLADHAGNLTLGSWQFVVDTAPPSLDIVPFPDPYLTVSPVVSIAIAFADGGSGIDPTSLQVLVDGLPLESSCTFLPAAASCATPPLDSGAHVVSVSVRDRVGIEASATLSFNLIVDTTAPVVSLSAPSEVSYQRASTVLVSGVVTDDGPIDRVEVNGQLVGLTSGSFSMMLQLVEGANAILVVAVDRTGKQGFAQAVVTLDTAPPLLALDSPRDQQLSNVATVHVAGTVEDSSGIAQLEINGDSAELLNGRFDADVQLTAGPNAISVEATDLAGNVVRLTRNVTYVRVPEIAITEPTDLSWIASTTIDVVGTVSEGATVEVNGRAAEVSGPTFVALGIPLVEGGNVVTAAALAADGGAATAHVQVVRDLTAPRLEVATPRQGQTIFEGSIPVAGLVNDIVAGTVNASEAVVTVNGESAEVSNRQFLLPSLSLAPGSNAIEVEARDESGNSTRALVEVYYETSASSRLRVVSGNGQTGIIGDLLSAPLRVQVVDSTGIPVNGRQVLFEVIGGDGSLEGGGRTLAVATDSAGEASAAFRLGNRAGAGNQVVRALVAGIGEAEFVASALPGEPILIVPDAGSQQVGVAGRAVPRPFVATVTDSGFNRLANVDVRFSVTIGSGRFPDGATERLVATDSDGRAITGFVLGAEDGTANNVVVAEIAALSEGPTAAFTVSGWAAGEAADTVIEGVVLDNQNEAVPGVTLRIRDHIHTAVTNERGEFRMEGAPIGTIYLIADGSTSTRPGAWPDLEYVMTIVPGRENDLGMPVYLLPLDLGSGVFVNETTGGTIELPEIPGFALEIAPGSVTFPGGSKSGLVSVTMVHSDRVPMIPNFGQQPRLIVTIQPAGARFDPPARMVLPNVEGLTPRSVTEFYSFDHDLGHFVSIGPATVSSDGLVIASNSGVGILKAGWHCGGNPPPDGCLHACGDCRTCARGNCAADDSQEPPQDHPADCFQQVCSGGFVKRVPAPTEVFEPIPGNCSREFCGIDGFMHENDLSDARAGLECCGIEGVPEPLAKLMDPETTCCVNGVPKLKTPVEDPESCPDRVQNEKRRHDFDGCSVSNVLIALGNTPFSGDADNPAGGADTQFSEFPAEFGSLPCDVHDLCYQTCRSDWSECDAEMYRGMLQVCASSTESALTTGRCFSWADAYWVFLRAFGWIAFDERQSEYCKCCP